MNGKIKIEIYYINDCIYRESKPSIIRYYDNGSIKCEKYCYDNKYHREDGPAVIEYYMDGKVQSEQYFINDEVVNIERYNDIDKDKLMELINNADNVNLLLRLKLILSTIYKQYETELLELIEAKITMLQLL